jgi:hypothetical protein
LPFLGNPRLGLCGLAKDASSKQTGDPSSMKQEENKHDFLFLAASNVCSETVLPGTSVTSSAE